MKKNFRPIVVIIIIAVIFCLFCYNEGMNSIKDIHKKGTAWMKP